MKIVYIFTPTGVTRVRALFCSPRHIAVEETFRGNHAVYANGKYIERVPNNPEGWFASKPAGTGPYNWAEEKEGR